MFFKIFSILTLFSSLFFSQSVAQSVDLGCTNNLVLSSKNVECVLNKDVLKCETNLNAEVSLINVKDSACLSFSYENETVIDLIISFKEFKNIITTKSEYFTTEWYGVSANRGRCNGADLGSKNCLQDVCQNILPMDRNPYNQFVEEWASSATAVPGVTKCLPRSGGPEYGCGVMANGCLFTRAGLAPVIGAEMYEILSPVQHIPLPVINIVYINNKNNKNGIVDEIQGIVKKYSFEEFDISVQGSFGNSFDDFGGKGIAVPSFMNPAGIKYFTPFSPQQSPQKGSVGDLQANSPSHISALDYLIATNVFWEGSVTADAVNYVFDTPGVTIMKNTAKTLPVQIGNSVYDFYREQKYGFSNVLIGDIQSAGTLKVFLQTANPISWSTTVKAVCPKILGLEVYNLSCYNCQAGSKLLISGKAECNAGQVSIKIISEDGLSLLSNTIYFNKNITNTSITFISPKSQIKASVCVFEKYSVETCINFTAILMSDVDIRKLNLTTVVGKGTTGSSSDVSIDAGGIWDSIVSHFQLNWKIYVYVAAAVVGLIILIVIAVVTYKCLFLKMATTGRLGGPA